MLEAVPRLGRLLSPSLKRREDCVSGSDVLTLVNVVVLLLALALALVAAAAVLLLLVLVAKGGSGLLNEIHYE